MSDVDVCFDRVSDDDATSETSNASKSNVSSLNSNDEEINILRESSDDESGKRGAEYNWGTGPDIDPVEPAVGSTSSMSKQQNDFIKHFYNNRRHFIRCDACLKYADIVKLYAPKERIPPMTTESGTRYRTGTYTDHLRQKYHCEAVKPLRLSSISSGVKAALGSPIIMSVTKANEKLARKIGGFMLYVSNDAKRLTLTPHSFPSRIVAEILSTNFDMIDDQKSINTSDLQYLNPTAYRELLACIVETDKAAFRDKLMKSSAISMRCDGSVDRRKLIRYL